MLTLTWSNGYIRNDTGAVGSDPKGLVSNTFVGDGRKWHVSVATGFKIIKAARYGGSSRGTFEAIVMPLGEYTDFDITFENGKYYSFALTNVNVSNISPSDVSNDTVEMAAYGVTISYQNSTIATMDETGVKTLLTGSTFCEDDIIIAYTADQTYSITKTLTNIITSNDDSTVVAGNSFYMDLTPANNYVISAITVTMGGVDITDQVFKAGTGGKAVTANGTYNASGDGLSGYGRVVVNVPGTSPSLGTKTIMANGIYNASSDSLDGYSSVTVAIPSALGVSF